MKTIKVGIIGSAGYTGGELIRLLLHHPQAEIVFAYSTSSAAELVSSVHQDLVGDTELRFSAELDKDVDVVFLCLGHGKSQQFLEQHSWLLEKHIIDLSNDFRLAAATHDFVYGLPELQRDVIRQARHIANPGCFATAIQLALLPIVSQLEGDIHVSAITGSTGAGQALSDTLHYSWRSNNMQVYKAFNHQHIPEIQQSLYQRSEQEHRLHFIPYRGNFTRGIIASVYARTRLSIEELQTAFDEYYAEHPFTLRIQDNPDVKRVVNTNKCLLYVEKHDDTVLIVSVLDNLLKGASGQAVQNMNLMFGIEETVGLQLKAMVF